MSATTINNKQKIKVGINGFGRIGRLLARFCLAPESPLQLVHVNDIHGDASTAAYLLQFDSVHGRFVGYECKAVEAMNSAYQNIFVAYRAISQRPLKYFLDIRAEIEDYDHHRGGGCYDYEYESDSESGDTEPESEDEDHQLDGPYTQDDYINFYNLLKHSGMRIHVIGMQKADYVPGR